MITRRILELLPKLPSQCSTEEEAFANGAMWGIIVAAAYSAALVLLSIIAWNVGWYVAQ